MAFPFRVLTMQGPAYEGEILSVQIPTELGPLTIEQGYTNFVGALSPAGVMKVVTAAKTDYFAVFGGVIDVRKGGATTLYVEEINPGYEIDLARAIAARDRNLDRIEKKPEGIDIQRARIKLAKALVRISVKQLTEGGQ